MTEPKSENPRAITHAEIDWLLFRAQRPSMRREDLILMYETLDHQHEQTRAKPPGKWWP